jgi:hypothetical protein
VVRGQDGSIPTTAAPSTTAARLGCCIAPQHHRRAYIPALESDLAVVRVVSSGVCGEMWCSATAHLARTLRSLALQRYAEGDVVRRC